MWVTLTVDNDGLFADMWLGCVIIGRNSAVETRRQLEWALCKKFIQELLHSNNFIKLIFFGTYRKISI